MLMGLAGRNEALPGILRRCLSTRLGPESSSTISELLKAYEVDTSATVNTTETIIPVLNFLNDIGFYYPARIFVQAWSESNTAFLCHFNSPNPWDGPWKGYATHVLDIVFVLQNYNAYLSPGQRACAERFAGDVIRFVNGGSPWRNWERSAPAAMAYYAKEDGERDESALVPNGESKLTGRRHVLEKIVGKDRFDELLDIMSMVLAGR
jgi:carboxylesterase type B